MYWRPELRVRVPTWQKSNGETVLSKLLLAGQAVGRQITGRWADSRPYRVVVAAVIAFLFSMVAYVDSLFSQLVAISNLYYFPILISAAYFGYPGALLAAGFAIGFFHLIHVLLPGQIYFLPEADVARLILFVGVGLVTARLIEDRKALKRQAKELAERNEELSRLNGELEKMSQAKSRFVAVASHELRTPLTTILMSAELLSQRRELDVKKKSRLLSTIKENAERMRSRMDVLLNISIIESGRLPLQKEEVGINELIEDCRRMFTTQWASRILAVESGAGPASLYVDRDKIVQVLTNLLSNALKYSENDSKVFVQTQDCGEFMEVMVKDEGFGIPKEDLDRIFEPYYRGNNGKSSQIEGAGLGLALSRDIVRAHGGEVKVHSEPGKGSVFAFTLPLASTEGTRGESLNA